MDDVLFVDDINFVKVCSFFPARYLGSMAEGGVVPSFYINVGSSVVTAVTTYTTKATYISVHRIILLWITLILQEFTRQLGTNYQVDSINTNPLQMFLF